MAPTQVVCIDYILFIRIYRINFTDRKVSFDILSQNTLYPMFPQLQRPCQGQDSVRNMAKAHLIHHKQNLPSEIQAEIP